MAACLLACLQREADLRDSLNRANKELRGLQARSEDADKAAEAKQAALSEAQVRAPLHTVACWVERKEGRKGFCMVICCTEQHSPELCPV